MDTYLSDIYVDSSSVVVLNRLTGLRNQTIADWQNYNRLQSRTFNLNGILSEQVDQITETARVHPEQAHVLFQDTYEQLSDFQSFPVPQLGSLISTLGILYSARGFGHQQYQQITLTQLKILSLQQDPYLHSDYLATYMSHESHKIPLFPALFTSSLNQLQSHIVPVHHMEQYQLRCVGSVIAYIHDAGLISSTFQELERTVVRDLRVNFTNVPLSSLYNTLDLARVVGFSQNKRMEMLNDYRRHTSEESKAFDEYETKLLLEVGDLGAALQILKKNPNENIYSLVADYCIRHGQFKLLPHYEEIDIHSVYYDFVGELLVELYESNQTDIVLTNAIRSIIEHYDELIFRGLKVCGQRNMKSEFITFFKHTFETYLHKNRDNPVLRTTAISALSALLYFQTKNRSS